MLDVLLSVLLPIATAAAIGAALRRSMILDITTLNRVMFYGLSPLLIFVSLASTTIAGGAALRMMALSVLLVGSLWLVCQLVTWLLKLDRPSGGALELTVLFMNSGNYGLPAARFAFGDEGFTQAVLYFIAQAILAQTFGVALAAASSSQQRHDLLRQVTVRLLRMPQIYAVLAALAVRATGVDLATLGGFFGGIWQGIVLVSEAALPVMILILGMQIAEGVTIKDVKLVSIATFLRLIFSPVLAFGLCLLLGLDGVALSVGVLLGGMPTAVNTTITALEFDTRPQVVVGTVVVSSVLSLLTLSVVLSLL